jgi:ribonucleoside-triphosphate reductase
MMWPSNNNGSEITLRSGQHCNLSECCIRADDTMEDLERKVRQATILGTLQATLTDFKYLRKKWKKNTEEEALLGVSLTGIMDNSLLNGEAPDLAARLKRLKEVAIETNQEWAEKLGINPSAAITCVKPSGTVSQLCNTASGIHARYSPYYVRSVRGDNKDPLTRFLKDAGVKHEPCVMKGDTTTVFYFPIKAPENAVYREDRTAIEQLELWKTYQLNWCEHKPSITVSVKEHEWLEVGAWVYENFDVMSGVSFLPWDGGTYKQAPYQECTEEEYYALLEQTPQSIDWTQLSEYETEDTTSGSQTYACSADGCEVVDIGD